MGDFLAGYYLWLQALHVIAVITWMAGLFYLPRLFVYHSQVEPGSQASETFKVMERKLLRIIMNPSLVAVWVLGLLLIWAQPGWLTQGWLHIKIAAVVLLTVSHMAMAKWRRLFAGDANPHDHRFYRWANEAPTVLLLVIIFMVYLKPFAA